MVPISKLGALYVVFLYISKRSVCDSNEFTKTDPAVNEYCAMFAYLEFFVNYGCMFQVCLLQKRLCERFCSAKLSEMIEKALFSSRTRKNFTKFCDFALI
jgi:hypothetical protein